MKVRRSPPITVAKGSVNTIPDSFDPLFATQLREFLWQDGTMEDFPVRVSD